MKSFLPIGLIAALAVLLSACGNKGPLTLPPPAAKIADLNSTTAPAPR